MFFSNLTELTMGQGYRRFFRVVPALSDALRAENYRIRHEVYCRDLGFEPLRSDSLEADDYDERSIHCLVQSVSTGAYVGCARLVLTDADTPQTPLPVEVTCAATLDRSLVEAMARDRSQIAEISRLAVVGNYRRRQGEQDRPISISDEDFGTETRPRQPYLALAVYLGMISLARHYGISTLLVLTEPRLATNLARLGVRFERIGGEVHHRGVRFPSLMSVDEVIGGMNILVRALFEIISREIKEGIELAGQHAVRANHSPLP